MKILETRLYQYIDLLILRYPQLIVAKDCIVEAYQILEESYTNDGKLLVAGVDKGFLYAVPTAPQGDYYYAVSGNRIALNNCSYGIEKASSGVGSSENKRKITVSFINGLGTGTSGVPYSIFIEQYILGNW